MPDNKRHIWFSIENMTLPSRVRLTMTIFNIGEREIQPSLVDLKVIQAQLDCLEEQIRLSLKDGE